MLGDDVEQTAAAAVVVSAEARDDGKKSVGCIYFVFGEHRSWRQHELTSRPRFVMLAAWTTQPSTAH